MTTLFFALRSSKVQTYVAQKITDVISERLGLPIHISKLEIEFFNELQIDDLYIEDLNQDTLFYLQSLNARFSYFSLLQKKILLNQLEVQEIYIDINRAYNDSLFNIDHLELSSFGNKASSEEKDNSASSWDLQLEDLVLRDIRVNYEDKYAGFVLNSSLKELQVSCRYFRLGDNQIELQESILREADINILQLVANPTYLKKDNPIESIYLPFYLENSALQIENSCFSFNNARANKSATTKFDPNHLSLNQINAQVENILFAYDSLYADLQSLSLRENSGLKIEHLQSNFSFANEDLLFQNLSLNTASSSLNANASLSYSSLLDFRNFIEEVRFDLDILDAKIDAREIAYFVSNDKINWNNEILIDGHLYGKVSSFKSKDLHIKTARNSIFDGEFSMNGLPNIKETFISGKVNRLRTDFSDIIRIYPSLPLPENLRKLGLLDFKGNFDGFLNDFVTYGRLKTDLGIAQTDLNFKLDKENNAYYSGNFALEDFDIGRYFAKEDIFGKVSLNGSAKGKGIKLSTLDLEIDALIEKVEIKNYSYNQVQINGHLKDKFFEGHLDIDDENLALVFDGTIDASQAKPSFKFEAEMKNFNPKALNLWNRDMNLKADLSADFTASNIDDLIGKVRVNDLVVATEDKSYDLGNIVLESNVLVNGEKRFKLLTQDFDAEVEGAFNWLKVPNAIKSVLIPNYKDNASNQLMRFELNIRKNPEILALFVPKLSILKPSIIEGNFNSNTQSMLARMDVPLIQYQDFSVFNLSSNIYVNQGNFDMINSVPLVYYKDSVLLQDLAFLVNGPRNNLDLKLYTDGAENTSIELLANMVTKNKRVKFVFEPSNIFINKQFWLIDEHNEITISERVQSKNLKLYNGISELLIDLDLGSKDQKADVYLSNIFIQDFTQFLAAKDIELKGIVNGRMGMEMLEGEPGFFGNLMVENIEVNSYKVGNLNANANLDLSSKKVKINANLYGDDNEVDINGSYSFDSKSSPKDIDLQFDVKNFAIYSIEDFIAQYIDNVQGTVSGKLSLSGPRTKPDLLGYLDINDVTTTVTFLQTTYNIKEHRVIFEKNAINLGNNIRITDMDGNEAFGKGKILHKNLKDIALDIDAWSEKIMGLNT
ncbi:MAG: translocation/assembly module TamB domain-containing protein, partial [Chitinophagales bacterium]